jgi:large subunit ribosomal protein L18
VSVDVKKRQRLKERRKKRIRGKISGTQERPRLSLFRSSRHVYAQVVDDVKGHTLVSVSSFEKGQVQRANKEHCIELGKLIAKRCQEVNIKRIVFDKNGNKYHGRVKAFADGAREGGLDF